MWFRRFLLSFVLAVLASAPVFACPAGEGFIEAPDGVRLFYKVVGAGEQVVMVPVVYWNQERFAELGEDFCFVFYDPRDRGRSDSTDLSRATVEQDLEDLETVRAHLELSPVSLIGTSYYGALVALYAARHPKAVDRVMMVGAMSPTAELFSGYDPPEKLERTPQAVLDELAARDETEKDRVAFCRAYWAAQAPKYVGDPANVWPRSQRCELENEWPENINKWGTAVFANLGSWSFEEEARKVQATSLVLHGSLDLIVPLEGSRRWVQLLPDAKLMVLPQGGHMPWFGQPEALFSRLRRFMQGEWPEGAERVKVKKVEEKAAASR